MPEQNLEKIDGHEPEEMTTSQKVKFWITMVFIILCVGLASSAGSVIGRSLV